MIKIALVLPGLSFGGAQTMVIRLLKGLDRSKYDVMVFVRGKRFNNAIEDEMETLEVPCRYLGIHDGGSLLYKSISYFSFQKVLNEYNPDIVHVHLESIYSYVYAITNRKKLIVTVHSWPDRIVSKPFKTFAKILKNRMWVVGCAKCVAERAKEIITTTENFTAIYNPIEVGKYYCQQRTEHDAFQFIHIGRLTKIKNQELLLKAFAKVHEKKPQPRLLVVGDGELRNSLEVLSKELQIDSAVSFLGNRSDIPDLLAKSDAFVMSSDSECCPMVELEAMASRLPIISTDVGGIKEIAGKAGEYAEKGDLSSLANAMLRVVEDECKRMLMAKCAWERVQQFDISGIAIQYEELYDNVNSN